MPRSDKSVQVAINVYVDVYMSNSSQSTSSTSAGGEAAAAQSSRPAAPDPALDSIHMMLDPHLRPVSPDPDDDTSKAIFEEHKQIAQEYLKVQTDLAYRTQHKAELESGLDEETLRRKRQLIQLENEKNSLIKLFRSLKKELHVDDSWVLLPEETPNE